MGQTLSFGLIGDPVSHSLSPFIMNRAFEKRGIDGRYELLETSAHELPRRFDDLRARKFSGVSVTFPLKGAVLSRVDETTPAVRVIGAANTLEFHDTIVRGHNTDASGTTRAMTALAGYEPAGRNALILGAGGAARAAAYGLLSAGAASVRFAVRDTARAEGAVSELRRTFPQRRLGCYDINEVLGDGSTLASADVIINATPIGMDGCGDPVLVADGEAIGAHHLCFEFVYKPLVTPFLETARRRGAQVLDGLALLVAQARDAFEIWTGETFSIEEMYNDTRRHVAVDGAS